MLLHCATLLGISSGEDRDVASGGAADGGHGGVGGSSDGGAGVPSLVVAWADRWGAATNENVTGIAADDEGNVILVGSHYGPWMLAGSSIPHVGAGDVFAAKFHPQNGALWAHGWGDDADQVALAVTQRLENEHQTYITGYYDGTLDVGNGTPPLSNSDNYDGFVVRVGDNSGPNSIYPFSGPMLQRPGPIGTVSAAQQNLLITGYTLGDMGIAGSTIPASGQARGFLARIYGGGQPDWALSFGTFDLTDTQEGRGIATDSANNVAVVGRFTGQLAIKAGGDSAVNGQDAFVAVLLMGVDSATLKWIDTIGTTGDEVAEVVAISEDGGVVVAGTVPTDVSIGPFMLENTDGDPDVFVARYDVRDGTVIWAKSFTGTDVTPRALLVRDNTIYLGGDLRGSVQFDGALLTSNGTDAFVVALDASDGAVRATKLLGDSPGAPSADQTLVGMAFSPIGSVMVTGNMDGTMLVEDKTLTSSGGTDVYLLELSPIRAP
jgi:hypothetical protein